MQNNQTVFLGQEYRNTVDRSVPNCVPLSLTTTQYTSLPAHVIFKYADDTYGTTPLSRWYSEWAKVEK